METGKKLENISIKTLASDLCEFIDGEKETFIDYIEKILNDDEIVEDYDIEDLQLLVEFIEESGGKRGKDL